MFTRSLPELRQGCSRHDLQRVPASPWTSGSCTLYSFNVRSLVFSSFVGTFKVSVALRRALLTGIILKGLTLRKFVSGVCVCMFYVCEVIGFVDWLDRGLIYNIYRHILCEKSLELCICLWPEFDCPEVTLCGWQDIKIQLLLLLLLFHGDH